MAEAPLYDDSLTIALLRARDAVTAPFREHVAEAGLTLQQWRVIRTLSEAGMLDANAEQARRDRGLPPTRRSILAARPESNISPVR